MFLIKVCFGIYNNVQFTYKYGTCSSLGIVCFNFNIKGGLTVIQNSSDSKPRFYDLMLAGYRQCALYVNNMDLVRACSLILYIINKCVPLSRRDRYFAKSLFYQFLWHCRPSALAHILLSSWINHHFEFTVASNFAWHQHIYTRKLLFTDMTLKLMMRLICGMGILLDRWEL